MIRSCSQLPLRYLKLQKKRTMLNILGVLMSAALITGTGTIIESVKAQMIRHAIESEGNFHVSFKNIDSKQASVIRNHMTVEQSCTGRIEGFAVLAETGDGEIPYRLLRLNQNDDDAIKMLQIEKRLKEGRLPRTAGEIAVDGTTMKILGSGTAVGSRINLVTGQRRRLSDGSLITSYLYPLSLNDEEDDPQEYFETDIRRSFVITGILSEDFYMSENYASNAVTWTKNSGASADDKFNMLIRLNDLSDVDAAAEAIAAGVGIDSSDILYNHRLLSLLGGSTDDIVRRSINVFTFIVIAIIVIATIAVIYNSFNISLLERISQFGIMRCIGASPKQIRNLILREAGLISLAAVPPGIAVGIAAMRLVFRIADALSRNPLFEGIELVVSPGVVISSAAVCSVTVFVSAFFPALMAGRIPPMEAVRSTGMYSHDRTGRHRLARFKGPLGRFGTVMAYRNISRNRKRFLVTLFSMVVSVVLFVSFGGLLRFTDSLYITGNGNMPGIKVESKTLISDDVYEDLAAIEEVDLVIRYGQADISIIVEADKLSRHYYRYVDALPGFDHAGNDIVIPDCRILCYGDDAGPEIRKLIASGDDSGLMIARQALFRNEAGRKAYLPNSSYETGDSIRFEVGGVIKEARISAVLDDVYYEDFNATEGAIDIVVSEMQFAEITGIPGFSEIFIRLEQGGSKNELISYLNGLTNTRIGYNYIDAQAQAVEMSNESWALNLFFYGFIAVISLISCLNIINTISTNLLVRSREFGIIQAVGLDNAGLKRMILQECIIYSAAALILGGAAGTGLWYLLVREMSNIRMTLFVIPWREIGIAAAALLVITLLAGYFPVKRIDRKSIIENIKFEE